MKFTKVFLLSAATTLVASLSSCTDNDLGFTENEIKFNQNFVDRYGTIDPNHNWGFGELPVVETGNVATRAGSIDKNMNMWIEMDNNGYKDGALINSISIPGWPNFDGYYYADTNGGTDFEGAHQTNPSLNTQSQLLTAGDVTPYEIKVVNDYFRTHQYKASMQNELIQLHLTDFFIQNVSRDYDRVSYPNGDAITEINGSSIDYKMDYLHFKPEGANQATDETWTHINEYNAGVTNDMHEFNTIPADGPSTTKAPYRVLRYVQSSGTENFSCRPSFGTGTNTNEVLDYETADFIDTWVLVRLTWKETGADGNEYDREGYYLAFDYQSNKEDMKVSPDGYYTNWIVKISPANPQNNSKFARRVMCEDLGTTDDFDFNDVVFDVVYRYSTEWQDGKPIPTSISATVTVRAAGGTMNITVAGKDVHKYFGVDDKTMVNTGTNLSVDCPVFNFRIEDLSSIDPNDIPIVVTPTGSAGKYSYELKSTIGNAPQKICVPVGTKWTLERTNIETAYPDFVNWVSNRDITWTTNVDNSKLYDDGTVVTPETTDNPGGSSGNHGVYKISVATPDASMGQVYVDNGNNGNGGAQKSGETGTTIRIVAVPNNGYEFVKWVKGDASSTDVAGTTSTLDVTVGSSDATYTAIFKAEGSSVTPPTETDIDLSNYEVYAVAETETGAILDYNACQSLPEGTYACEAVISSTYNKDNAPRLTIQGALIGEYVTTSDTNNETVVFALNLNDERYYCNYNASGVTVHSLKIYKLK